VHNLVSQPGYLGRRIPEQSLEQSPAVIFFYHLRLALNTGKFAGDRNCIFECSERIDKAILFRLAPGEYSSIGVFFNIVDIQSAFLGNDIDKFVVSLSTMRI